VASGTIGLFAMILGTFLGGLLAQATGLGPALWVSGLLQIFSNVGYAVVAEVGVNRPVMYGAQAFEYVTTGMGSGALGVLLLRLTQRRFSATQYALLTSLFAIPRVLAGPVAGVLADTIGWRDFFLSTLVAGVPGLVMLYRFVPWGMREPEFEVAAPVVREPLGRRAVVVRAAAVAAAALLTALASTAVLDALRSRRAGKGFDPLAQLVLLLHPGTLGGWTTLLGISLLGVMAGLATAAALVARRSALSSPGE
jgi:PAT family beta-lactamase induction signal transducer AmpG